MRYTSAIDVWSLGCVMYELVQGKVLARATHQTAQGVLTEIITAIGPCPAPLKAHYGDGAILRRAERDAAATSQGHASAILVRDIAPSEAAACVSKTMQWKPSGRPACEELLQMAWMQPSGDISHGDSAEVGAAESAYRPHGGSGLGGSGSSGTQPGPDAAA